MNEKFTMHEQKKIELGHTISGSQIKHFQLCSGWKVYLYDKEDELIVNSDDSKYLIKEFIQDDSSKIVGIKVKEVNESL